MDLYIQKRLQQFRAQGVTRVKAQGSGRKDECESCRALSGIEFPIDEFPMYPPAGCTCPLGCGCVAVSLPEGSFGSRALIESNPSTAPVVLLDVGS
jgi:hypothetical protein